MSVAWHGKLPSTGDFVTRRLDGAQLASLDGWLAAMMHAVKQRRGEAWLGAYLASPSWRFLWMPQALPTPWNGRAWAGVLMPSVDQVGRYYPLLMLHALDALPWRPAERDALASWLQRLDDIAASVLHDDWTIDALESSLIQLGEPPPVAEPLPALDSGHRSLRRLRLFRRSAAERVAIEAAACWADSARDHCYWYSATDGGEPTLLVSNGIEDAALSGALLGAEPVAPG